MYPNLETKRLILKPLQENDFDDMFKTVSDTRVVEGMEWDLWIDPKKHVEGFVQQVNSGAYWTIHKKKTDETTRRFIIEIDNKPSGEMNYRNKGDFIAEIGIKICIFENQEKGYGTKLLKMFIKYLFEQLKYRKIILDTKLKNKRAQYVYEKIGFTKTGMDENAIFFFKKHVPYR
jgi:RimJ/RimL family protein N-acetyltransferase